MNGFAHALSLDESGDLPLFLRIARAVRDDVRRGRLLPGAALPGSRTLATQLGVHRNTVLAAFRELAAEGWIETRPAGGTYVSGDIPRELPRRLAKAATRAGFSLPAAPSPRPPEPPPNTFVLAAGTPDLRLVPRDLVARAYRRALRSAPLGYVPPEGHPRLRTALTEMLAELRGLTFDRDALLVTRGAQAALDLTARVLLDGHPGAAVAVEALGYRPAWQAFRAAGARLVPVPVDEHGLAVDALAEIEGLRAVYLTPHHQYPTTVTLSPARRLALLALARARRFAIVEDDYDFEFHYEGRPVLPLASDDQSGNVIYVGTLAKILAPALRLGFLAGPAPFVAHATALRIAIDRQGDPALELAVAELLEDGELQRHVRRVRRAYRERRDALLAALDRHLEGTLVARKPPGGMAAWAEVRGVDAETLVAAAAREGVSFLPGRAYAFDGRARPFVRLGYASLDPSELDEAMRRVARGLGRRR
ncbi:MAG: PLP-dependent aminotransferase family protein [Myxococcales bacterium]|nr:PLP-dependent aminotransferase family protein [Myxococcales bacterium]